MSVEQGIRTLLSTGNTTASTRVYPLREPETPVYPLVLYRVRTNSPTHTRDASDDDERLDQVTVILNLVGDSYTQVHTLLGEVRRLVNGYSGTIGGAQFTRIFLVGEDDGYNPDERKFERAMTLTVWHKESM